MRQFKANKYFELSIIRNLKQIIKNHSSNKCGHNHDQIELLLSVNKPKSIFYTCRDYVQ